MADQTEVRKLLDAYEMPDDGGPGPDDPEVALRKAKAWMTLAISFMGAGFHPDTPAADYRINERYSFTMEQADEFDVHMEQVFGAFADSDEDIYAFGLTHPIFQEARQ